MQSRRDFLLGSAGLAGAATVTRAVAASPAGEPTVPHLACNQYVWQTFYQRQGKDLSANLDVALGEMAAAGLDGIEPIATSPADVERLAPLLRRHGLAMRSLYVNSTLHEASQVEASLEEIQAIAQAAREVGTGIIVTNPSPIRWGGTEDKSDEELRLQATAMNRLGGALSSLGLKLAYHNHDSELRAAAREFHHMMVGTDPSLVRLCLDAHWVYRGSGDSTVALFDVVQLYGTRVCELHLRQSRGGVWTECLESGDLDYPRLVTMLNGLGLRPHLVLEQAVESASPDTLHAVEAHQKSVAYARRVFAPLA